MNPAQMRAACAKYAVRLRSMQHSPQRGSHDVHLTAAAKGAHVLWMCTEVPRLLDDGYVDKAKRWFGFIQGAMWTLSVYTIADLRADSTAAPWDMEG